MFKKIIKFATSHFLYFLLGFIIFVITLILGEKNNLVKHFKLVQLKIINH